MLRIIKKMIKWVTGDGQTHYSGFEENAEQLARAWGKVNPDNHYEVIEVEDNSTSAWDGIL